MFLRIVTRQFHFSHYHCFREDIAGSMPNPFRSVAANQIELFLDFYFI